MALIITTMEKLKTLSSEEMKFILNNSKNGELKIIASDEDNSVPMDLINIFVAYNGKYTIEKLGVDSPFLWGYYLGFIVSEKKDVKLLLSSEIEENFNKASEMFSNIVNAKSSKKVAEPRKKTQTRVNVEKTQEIEFSLPPYIDTNNNTNNKKTPKKSEADEINNKSLIQIFKGTANLDICEIMNDSEKSSRLITCVKESTDKKIGFPFKLKAMFGEEICNSIVEEVSEKYDIIQQL